MSNTNQFSITSSAFEDHEELHSRYTCDGENISPPLAWSNPPRGTKSLALIVEDPDAPDPEAPKTIWCHWVLYNIPPETKSLPEGSQNYPKGTLLGSNDWEENQYGGPCPPIGRHRYFFRLFALNQALHDLHYPNKERLEQAMKGHILREATLIGTYLKKAHQKKSAQSEKHLTR